MFIFVREGRYVTATNKFWFWISILSALGGTVMSFILLKKAGQPVLGVILALSAVISGTLPVYPD